MKEINTRRDSITALEKQLEIEQKVVVDKLCPGVNYYIGHVGSTKIINAKVKAVKFSAGWTQLSNNGFIGIPRDIKQVVWFSFPNKYISINKKMH